MLPYIFIYFSSFIISLFRYKRNKYIVCFLVILILGIFAGTRSSWVGPDYFMYQYMFATAVREPQKFFLENQNLELSVYLIPNIIHFFFYSVDDCVKASFLAFAFISVAIKINVLKQSEYFFLGLMVYLSNLYLMQEMVTIRAGVASALFLWSLKDLISRNNKLFFIKIGVAFLFHNSSILFVIIWFIFRYEIKIKLFLYGLIISIIIAFSELNILRILFLDRIFPKVKIYLDILENEGGEKINVFNFRIIFALFITAVFLFSLKKLKENIFFMTLFKIHVFSLILFFLLSPTAMVFSMRSFELISVIQMFLYPLILWAFNPKFRFVGFIILCVFCIFQFYYLIELSEIFNPYESWLLK